MKRVRPTVYTEYIYFKPETAAIVRQDAQDPTGRTVVTSNARVTSTLKSSTSCRLLDQLRRDKRRTRYQPERADLNDPSKLPPKFPPTTNVKSTCRISQLQRGARVQRIAPVSAKRSLSRLRPTRNQNRFQTACKARRPSRPSSAPLPEKQIYTAPVEFGAGSCPSRPRPSPPRQTRRNRRKTPRAVLSRRSRNPAVRQDAVSRSQRQARSMNDSSSANSAQPPLQGTSRQICPRKLHDDATR